MYCTKCGKELKDGSRFCGACGSPQNAAPAISMVDSRTIDETVCVNMPPPIPPAHLKQETKKKNHFGFKLTLIIVIALLVILAAGAAVWFLVSENGSGNNNSQSDDKDESVTRKLETTSQSTAESEPSIIGLPESVYVATDTDTEEESTSEQTSSVVIEEPEAVEMDPIETLIMESDTRLFDYADVYDLTADECKKVRNGIYACHGRMFNSADLQEYFMEFDWYTPRYSPDNFNNDLLNEYEKANVTFMVEFEAMMGYR